MDILKLADEIKDLPEKGDVSDVIMKYGKDKTLEILVRFTKISLNPVKLFLINSINLFLLLVDFFTDFL